MKSYNHWGSSGIRNSACKGPETKIECPHLGNSKEATREGTEQRNTRSNPSGGKLWALWLTVFRQVLVEGWKGEVSGSALIFSEVPLTTPPEWIAGGLSMETWKKACLRRLWR